MQKPPPPRQRDKGRLLKVSSSSNGTSTRGTEHGDLCVGGAGTGPYVDPAGGCALRNARAETSTRSSGAQEQRGPKVDAALQLKQVAPAQNNESMINFVILNQISLFLYINLGFRFRV